ncbi:phosphatase PAP2 family protein [Acholeplasma vituli]|uniref:Phosphatase PAP2 family protein n=1 Tax=Paracholeplasma vituli TaxID=69473 RepID=A0ABT2Q061_9MOLU|nr:phosphatase PAP2 family protein [Paracholeplasma vituli]MCU0105377.1 phosphatase PAP2 family protein [Paracholeplasma vituli]
MQIIEFLQSLSNPVLDWTMRIITEVGDQYFFILLGAILYWTVDKKFAFKLMVSYLGSAFINGGLKAITNKPRPYQEGARAILQETTGSSMPSGHAQASGALAINLWNEYYYAKWVRVLMIAMIILVPLSRMYLGQHYLEDVLVGLVLGLILGSTFMFLLGVGNFDREHIRALYPIPVLLILMVFFHEEPLFVAGGAYIGLAVGYYFEKLYVKYKVAAPLKIQIIKVILGLVIALALKEGLKFVLPYSLFESDPQSIWVLILDFVRYLLIGLWASLGFMWVAKKLFKRVK